MTPQALLSCYESVALAAGTMLDAARASEWDQLVAAERKCAESIARLRGGTHPPALSAEAVRRIGTIIQTVLTHDAEIHRLTRQRVAVLEHFLGGAATEKRVARAYRPS